MKTQDAQFRDIDGRSMKRGALYERTENDLPTHVAVAQAACLLVKAGLPPYRASLAATALHAIGRKLHIAFERSCNTGESDYSATKRALFAIELLELDKGPEGLPTGIEIEFQGDPRGWPIIIRHNDTEIRVGGRP